MDTFNEIHMKGFFFFYLDFFVVIMSSAMIGIPVLN